MAEKVCGGAVPLEIVGRRPGDPPTLIGDASLARAVLDWKPVRSDLETQIGDAWNWIYSAQKKGIVPNLAMSDRGQPNRG